MSQAVDIKSYVLYRSDGGEKYHRSPVCAVSADTPPALDAAHSALESVEETRVRDVDPTREDLCDTCAARVARWLDA